MTLFESTESSSDGNEKFNSEPVVNSIVQDSVNESFDEKYPSSTTSGSLKNGDFLEMDTVFRLLMKGTPTLEAIPDSKKENIYFLISNADNLDRIAKKEGKKIQRQLWCLEKGVMS